MQSVPNVIATSVYSDFFTESARTQTAIELSGYVIFATTTGFAVFVKSTNKTYTQTTSVKIDSYSTIYKHPTVANTVIYLDSSGNLCTGYVSNTSVSVTVRATISAGSYASLRVNNTYAVVMPNANSGGGTIIMYVITLSSYSLSNYTLNNANARNSIGFTSANELLYFSSLASDSDTSGTTHTFNFHLQKLNVTNAQVSSVTVPITLTFDQSYSRPRLTIGVAFYDPTYDRIVFSYYQNVVSPYTFKATMISTSGTKYSTVDIEGNKSAIPYNISAHVGYDGTTKYSWNASQLTKQTVVYPNSAPVGKLFDNAYVATYLGGVWRLYNSSANYIGILEASIISATGLAGATTNSMVPMLIFDSNIFVIDRYENSLSGVRILNSSSYSMIGKK